MNPNKTKPHSPERHENYMGGASYFSKDPLMTLHMMSASAFFGEKKYYEGATAVPTPHRVRTEAYESLGETYAPDPYVGSIEIAIDAALDKSVEDTLAYALYLRKVGLMRTTPQVILARAAHHKDAKETGLIRKYASAIAERIDDVLTGLAYYLEKFGRPLPNGLKRGYSDRLRAANEYALSKYQSDSKNLSLRDAIKMLRCTSPAIDAFMKGEIKNTDTWEAMRSRGEKWSACIPKMGHMALLRNLRNLEQSGCVDEQTLRKLVDGVQGGKQFPFRYYSAFKNVSNDNTKRALEQCMEESLALLPVLNGKSLVLCDYSGSAQGATTSEYGSMRVCDIGGLLGILTCKVSTFGGDVVVFGDRKETVALDRRAPILTTVDRLAQIGNRIGQNTENGIWLALQEAIDRKIVYDRIVIFSDQQAGTGGLYGTDTRNYKHAVIHGRNIDVSKLFSIYRRQVNPDCRMYSTQIAGYSDNIFPDHYPNAVMLSGWSPALTVFMNAVEIGGKVHDLIREYRI